MRRFRLRTLVVAVAFFAMFLALVIQTWRASVRETYLRSRLAESEARLQEYRRRVETFLNRAEIRIPADRAEHPPHHVDSDK